MDCAQCNAAQDSTQVQCKKCGADLHPDLSSDALAKIRGDLKDWEEGMKVLNSDFKGNPYHPMDQVSNALNRLARRPEFPGMHEFLKHAYQDLLPHQVKLSQRTLTANMVLLFVLTLFPLVSLMVGWNPLISGVLALPVVAWSTIAFRAYRQHSRVKKRLNALEGS